MLFFLSRNFSLKHIDKIVVLHMSLVRPHLEYTVQFRWLHIAKDVAKLEAVQRNTRTSFQETLAQQNYFSFEKWRLQGKYIECFKILKGKCKQVQLDYTQIFFTNDAVLEWNKLPPSAVPRYQSVKK